MNAQSRQKQQVVALLKSFETRASEPVLAINPARYIQHNPTAEDGVEGFRKILSQVPKDSVRVNTVRVFQDGAFVFAHSDYEFFGPKVGFDIFRFEDGMIVEHWDNLQPTAGPNPSGHTMTDGPTEVEDLEKTEWNKKLVAAFVEDFLVNGRMEKLAEYIDGDRYVQHNPQIADGLSGLSEAVQAMTKAGITMKYDRVHKVLGEGNFVLVVSEGQFAGKPTSFYDLFRVHDGKVAEHWDTLEAIPAPSESKNRNGKFGF